MLDLLLKGDDVVDDTGMPRFAADIGIAVAASSEWVTSPGLPAAPSTLPAYSLR